jgi:hypothetical protein
MGGVYAVRKFSRVLPPVPPALDAVQPCIRMDGLYAVAYAWMASMLSRSSQKVDHVLCAIVGWGESGNGVIDGIVTSSHITSEKVSTLSMMPMLPLPASAR